MQQIIVDWVESQHIVFQFAFWFLCTVITVALLRGILKAGNWFVDTTVERISNGVSWVLTSGLASLGNAFTWPLRKIAMAWRKLRPEEIEEVCTPYLIMKLNKRTGAMDGQIIKGPCNNLVLSEVEPKYHVVFYRYSGDDPDTKKLMETYLEYRYGYLWKKLVADEEKDKARPARDTHVINYQKAIEIFDFRAGEDFSLTDLKKRYRSVMANVHPDKGGTNFFARQANEALEVIKKKKGW
jgi:hypothetical protein